MHTSTRAGMRAHERARACTHTLHIFALQGEVFAKTSSVTVKKTFSGEVSCLPFTTNSVWLA